MGHLRDKELKMMHTSMNSALGVHSMSSTTFFSSLGEKKNAGIVPNSKEQRSMINLSNKEK